MSAHNELNPAPIAAGDEKSVWTYYCMYYSRTDNLKSFAKEAKNMLWTICVILFVLWALGMLTSYTMGGIIHVLLVLALVVLLFRVLQGRRSIV
jgi:hypothetical protein